MFITHTQGKNNYANPHLSVKFAPSVEQSEYATLWCTTSTSHGGEGTTRAFRYHMDITPSNVENRREIVE